MDVLLLYSEAPQIHMHTMKIGVLDVSQVDGGFDFALFRQVAAPRLQALAPLRYQLVDIPGHIHHPMWRVNADIDLDYHLRSVSVPDPGGRRELDQLIGGVIFVQCNQRLEFAKCSGHLKSADRVHVRSDQRKSRPFSAGMSKAKCSGDVSF